MCGPVLMRGDLLAKARTRTLMIAVGLFGLSSEWRIVIARRRGVWIGSAWWRVFGKWRLLGACMRDGARDAWRRMSQLVRGRVRLAVSGGARG
jgi:hypothetical protein